MRRASGESSTGTQDTPVAHLWFTTRLRHHEADSGKLLSARRSWQPGHSTTMGEAPMEIDAVYGDKGKKGKDAKGKKGKDKGKGKHKGKHESSPKFEGYCGHCGMWGHKQKDCRYKNTVAEVDEEESVEPPNTARHESHHHFLVCFQLELRSPRRERSPR